MPLWLAALIVTVVWAIIAAVLAVIGRKELQRSNPQLPKTQQTLKEDAAWARAQKN
jgi:tetrahydromethanopterin S-methyltransferase subunit C